MKSLFYCPIKLEGISDQHVVFWSDTHFGHSCERWENPLWKARGFSSVDEHDEQLINRWNSKSSEKAIFFHLGDFMFGQNSEFRFEQTIHSLKFKELYIMPGNHCAGWKQCFSKQSDNIWHVTNNKKVIFVPNYLEAYINGYPFVLSHYPIISFNKQHSSSGSSIHLFGHTHNNIRNSEAGPILYKAKVWEVSVENSKYPINANEVKSIFKDRLPVTFDHHNQTIRTPF